MHTLYADVCKRLYVYIYTFVYLFNCISVQAYAKCDCPSCLNNQAGSTKQALHPTMTFDTDLVRSNLSGMVAVSIRRQTKK